MGDLDLNRAWDYLNKVAFGGQMTRPKIMAFRGCIESEVGLLLGCYHLGSSELMIHVGSFHEHPKSKGILETLYHEMCHQFKHEILLDDTGGDHGKVFKEIYLEGLRRLEAANR